MGGSSKLNPLKVFDTDYENYDIYYDCWTFLGLFSADNLSISARKTEMSMETQMKIRDVINEKLPHYDLDKGMYWTAQDDQCLYDWRFSLN